MASMRDWLLLLAIAVPLGAAAFVVLLPWIIQPLLWVLLSPRYRMRVRGHENVPREGPALLVANHVTWIDGFLVAANCPRRGKALVNADYFRPAFVGYLARRAGMIPVPFRGPKGQRAAIEAARAALDRGEVVGIFPEAQISRNGLTGPFYRGLEAILSHREHVPLVPVYLDNLWCSNFSFSGGHFFRKWPKQGLRRTVNIVYGPPVPAPATAFAARQAVLEAGVRAVAMRREPPPPLETIDPALPRLDHPTLGPLTGSTADFDRDGVRQTGHKPGTVGHPLLGVAMRVVDDDGRALPPDTEGRLEALLAGRPGWTDTGLRGQLDRDGFVRIASPAKPTEPEPGKPAES